jgi:predicted permease
LILIGHALSRTPQWRALDPWCSGAIVFTKLFLMPAFCVGFCVLMDRTLGSDGGLGWIRLKDPYDETFYIAAVAVAATPTMTPLVLMTELGGGNKAAIEATIFTQYLCAPFVLLVTLTSAIMVLHVT